MPQGSFRVDAYLAGGRWQHHRLRDHFGVESDLYVVLSDQLGPWEEGTPVHFVIDDLIDRLNNLESAGHYVTNFSANAYILSFGASVEGPAGTIKSVASVNATIVGPRSGSFTASAFITGGDTFTIDAEIRAQYSFTASAILA